VNAPVLEVTGLTAGYAGIPVVHSLDLTAEAGEVVAVLGANGAGKTSTLLAVSGLLARSAGEVRFGGDLVSEGRKPRLNKVASLARRGLAHVPEDRGLFSDLTVREHLRLGRPRRGGASLTDAAVFDRFPALAALAGRKAGLLSGGEQQMLALARALVGRPRLLLVDELSLGLAPIIVHDLLPVLRGIADDTGAAVVVVEQHVGLALEVADRAYLLERGRVTASGTAADMADRAEMLEAGYLGDGGSP
jgi:branched-chain amino acid transport system ATP-binding protein